MSAAWMKSPAFTGEPLMVRVPAAGRVAIRTANSAFGAGASAGSVKPKSAAVNV